jgi:cytosine/adenosine deaminase-related metal-dependent hydrolase
VLTDHQSQTALIPGLVNSHTHLEFTQLSTPLPAESTFAEWIRLIVAHRRARGEYPVEALRAGLCESAAAGVTTIGEIATEGWTVAPFTLDLPRTVAFREAVALDSDMIRGVAGSVRSHVKELQAHAAVMAGISPHAPYSVALRLFRVLVEIAHGCGAPLAVHLA